MLVIVESPTKAKTLARFLGSDFRIEATMGHIRDLPEKKLGVEITSKDGHFTFKPDYQIIPGRKTKVSELKKMAENSDTVILATDPDREGEAIAAHFKEVIVHDRKIHGHKKEFKRIVFHEITESAIKNAIADPHDLDIHLVEAQTARRILDRLVGYKLSPLLWNKLGKRWLSAGRVQSVAVRLIVDREREILAFVPHEYWLIEANLLAESGEFIARLDKVAQDKAEIKNKKEADDLLEYLQKAEYQIESIQTKEIKRNPWPPFTTSTLQQTASNRFGWTAKRTMRGAQSLYEEGFITYHRTDSTNLSAEAVLAARGFIKEVFGSNYLPPQARIYKTKSKVAQEAHEAIRPTDIETVSASDLKITANKNVKHLPEQLGRDAHLLYSLIWKRFLACQMREALFDQTSVSVSAKTVSTLYTFRASGSRLKFDGFLKLYERKTWENEEGNGNQNQLPKLSEGEILTLLKLMPRQKFTEPPARFNEASLIKALEEKGIGRPSTYAPIIATIQDRRYVEKEERKFIATDLGFAVNDFLVKYFPDIFDISFTAGMEDELDEIANGRLNLEKVLNNFYLPFKKKLDEAFLGAQKVKLNLGETDEKCAECGHPLVIRMSKFGKFLACSNFPECKFTKNILEKAGIACPQCNGDIIVKKTRRGKQFYGCANYPKCQFAAWKKEDIKPVTPIGR